MEDGATERDGLPDGFTNGICVFDGTLLGVVDAELDDDGSIDGSVEGLIERDGRVDGADDGAFVCEGCSDGDGDGTTESECMMGDVTERTCVLESSSVGTVDDTFDDDGAIHGSAMGLIETVGNADGIAFALHLRR